MAFFPLEMGQNQQSPLKNLIKSARQPWHRLQQEEWLCNFSRGLVPCYCNAWLFYLVGLSDNYFFSFSSFLRSTIMSVLVHENLEADLPINVVASTVEYCVILSGRGLQANFPFPLPAVVTATTWKSRAWRIPRNSGEMDWILQINENE